MKAVFDTNILIDYFNGVDNARNELDLYDDKLISIITWIELMVGTNTDNESKFIKSYLKSFNVVSIENKIASKAVKIKKYNKIKLPDALIYATAKEHGCILVTRNTKDFDPSSPDIREPYRVGTT
ncbi:MAG: type II toxin-antitoxin system VapC family toxin [Thermodesulfobacteriota bacterium]